jgi:hypothetical protein
VQEYHQIPIKNICLADYNKDMNFKRDMLLVDNIDFQNEVIRKKTPELKEL